jgi:lipopolysaccharide biosynthesis regulator YciM
VIFYLGHLDASAGAPPDRVIALLNRALEINPGYYEARLELGLVAARAKKFEIAAAALSAAAQSGNKHPEHAYVVSYTLAYCYAQLHQPERAFDYAERAAHAVRNSQDEEQTANLLRYIERDRQRLSAAALAVH